MEEHKSMHPLVELDWVLQGKKPCMMELYTPTWQILIPLDAEQQTQIMIKKCVEIELACFGCADKMPIRVRVVEG